MREEVRTVTFRFLGQDVKITYRLGAMGASLSEWFARHGTDVGSLHEMIEKVLTAWDVTDEDGNVLPTTRDAIIAYDIPTPFLTAVFEAVNADATPGELKKSTSGAGNTPKVA